MKFHGIQIEEGATVDNLTVKSSTVVPTNPEEGELFFLQSQDDLLRGLYCFTGGVWEPLKNPADFNAVSFITTDAESVLASSRYLQAMERQLLLTDSGGGGTLQLGLAPNTVIPGTEGITLPAGSTAQRSATPANGELRYNTDIGMIEGYFQDAWIDIVDGNSSRIKFSQVLTVRKDPSSGDFSSIATALASITDAGPSKQYAIRVLPGTYVEPSLVMKPYITIVGYGLDTTVIQSANASENLIVACAYAGITFVTITGATGIGASLIHLDQADGDIQNSFTALNIRMGTAYRLASVTRGSLQINNVSFGGTNTFTQGFLSENSTTGSRLVVRNAFTTRLSAPYPQYLIKISGTNAFGVANCIFNRARGTGVPNTVEAGVGIWLRDGGQLRGQAISILGYDKGLWVENAGAAPELYVQSISLTNNVADLVIEHPGTQGAFNGTASRDNAVVASTDLALLFLDENNHSTNILGSIYLGSTLANSTDVTDLIQTTTPVGVVSGSILSLGTGPLEVVISEGYGYHSDATSGRSRRFAWPTSTLTLPDNQYSFIYVSPNQTVEVSVAFPNYLTDIVLGGAYTRNGAIVRLIPYKFDASHSSTRIDNYLRTIIGPVVTSGLVTTQGTTSRKLSVTAGSIQYSTLPFVAVGGADITFETQYRSAGAWAFSSGVTQVSNTQYDNGSGLTSLGLLQFTKHLLMVSTNNGVDKYYLVYGQSTYSFQTNAEAGALPTVPPSLIDAVPIAGIVVQQGDTDIVSITDARPRINGTNQTALAPADHGSLTGLTDDDHTQYFLTNGNRTLGGNLNMGGNDITNVNLVDGLNVNAHGSRHNPNGADPISTAAAQSLTTATTNTVGIANSVARSDHTHQIIGFQPLDIDLTALAALSTSGISVRSANSVWETTSIVAEVGEVEVTNGSGIGGNISIGLAPTGIAGTYLSVTTDSFGRVISGSTVAAPTTSSKVLQLVSVDMASATTTATIPSDNTTPLSTEGALLATLAIRPSTLSSKITGTLSVFLDNSGSNRDIIVSVFRGTTLVSLGVANVTTSGRPQSLSITFSDLPASIADVTYNVRIGGEAGTTYINRGSTATYGNAGKSSFVLIESI